MMTTEHIHTPEEVMACLDGELPASQQQAIEDHLVGCADCRQLAEDLRSLSVNLASWKVEDIQPATVAVPESAKPSRPSRFGIRWPWMLAPASVLGLLLLSTSARHTKPMRTATKTFLAPEPAQVSTSSATLSGYASDQPTPAAPSPAASRIIATDFSRAQTSADGKHGTVEAPMIARTASLIILAPRLDAARAFLDRIVAQHGGYTAELTAQSGEGTTKESHASVRVPAKDLDDTLAAFRNLGEVTEEARHGEEVSAQHQDLQVRLQNAQETEARMRGIFAERTGKLSEVLEVEQEISRVRQEIEAMEADVRTLDRRVAYATIDVTLTEQLHPVQHGSRLSTAWRSGWQSLRENLISVAVFLEESGPTLLFWGLLVGIPAWLGRRRYRRFRARL